MVVFTSGEATVVSRVKVRHTYTYSRHERGGEKSKRGARWQA
jgi:hypothetical protein